MTSARIKVGKNFCSSREELGCDQAGGNYNERLPGLGNVELDIQEEKEVSSQYNGEVCVCISHIWNKQRGNN